MIPRGGTVMIRALIAIMFIMFLFVSIIYIFFWKTLYLDILCNTSFTGITTKETPLLVMEQNIQYHGHDL